MVTDRWLYWGVVWGGCVGGGKLQLDAGGTRCGLWLVSRGVVFVFRHLAFLGGSLGLVPRVLVLAFRPPGFLEVAWPWFLAGWSWCSAPLLSLIDL